MILGTTKFRYHQSIRYTSFIYFYNHIQIISFGINNYHNRLKVGNILSLIKRSPDTLVTITIVICGIVVGIGVLMGGGIGIVVGGIRGIASAVLYISGSGGYAAAISAS